MSSTHFEAALWEISGWALYGCLVFFIFLPPTIFVLKTTASEREAVFANRVGAVFAALPGLRDKQVTFSALEEDGELRFFQLPAHAMRDVTEERYRRATSNVFTVFGLSGITGFLGGGVAGLFWMKWRRRDEFDEIRARLRPVEMAVVWIYRQTLIACKWISEFIKRRPAPPAAKPPAPPAAKPPAPPGAGKKRPPRFTGIYN